MLEVLQFMFSGFGTFIGCLLLLSVVAKIILGIVAIIVGRGNDVNIS